MYVTRNICTWIFTLFITGTAGGIYNRFGDDPINNVIPTASIQFTYFDTELLEDVTAKRQNENIVLAPASTKAVLALLYHGANGTTQSKLKALLNLPMNNTEAETQLRRLDQALRGGSSKVLMKYSNAVYLADNLKLNMVWKDTAEREFKTQVNNVNFDNPQIASDRINRWVKRQTDNLISDIISPDSINRDTRMVIVNAMYFKGKWLNKFPKEQTKIEKFTLMSQKQVDVHMMKTKGYYKLSYERSLNSDVIQIPFQDKNYAFVAVLPTNKLSIHKLVKDIDHNMILEILQRQDFSEVNLSLPRFHIEFSKDLVDSLTSMMKTNLLFSNRADLPNIAYTEKYGLKVDSIVHKATIDVNEDGAEASAATGASIVPLMTPTTETFNANHPFVFFIYNTQEQIILYEGVVQQPTLATANRVPDPYNQPTNSQWTTTRPVLEHNGIQPSYRPSSETQLNYEGPISVNTKRTTTESPDFNNYNPPNTWAQAPKDNNYANPQQQHINHQSNQNPLQPQQLANQNSQQFVVTPQDQIKTTPLPLYYQQNPVGSWPHTAEFKPQEATPPESNHKGTYNRYTTSVSNPTNIHSPQYTNQHSSTVGVNQNTDKNIGNSAIKYPS